MCKSPPQTVTPGSTRGPAFYFPLTRNLGAEPRYHSELVGYWAGNGLAGLALGSRKADAKPMVDRDVRRQR